MTIFFRKKREEKEEKRREERVQLIGKLKADTALSLRILREIKTQPPREGRNGGIHNFHYNTTIYNIQRNYILSKLREAETGSKFEFTLGDIGTSKEELEDIRFAAVKADIVVDAKELGLTVTERSSGVLERSRLGSVVGDVELG